MRKLAQRLRAAPSRSGGFAVLQTLAATGAMVSMGFVTGVLTARGLPPSERGILIALGLWVAVAGLLALRGLDEALIWTAKGAPREASAVRRALRIHVLIGVFITLLIFIPFGMFLQRGWTVGTLWTSFVCALIVPLNAITQMRLAVLRSGNQFLLWNALRLTPQFLYAAGLIGLVATGSLTVTSGVLALVIANLMTATVSTASTRSVHPSRYGQDLGDVRRYGRGVLAVQAPALASQRIDQFVLSVVGSARDLGIYAVAVSIGSLIYAAAMAVEQVTFPRYCRRVPSTREMARLTGAIGISSALVVAIVITAGHPVIGFFYGPFYTEAYQATVWIVVAAAITAALVPSASALKASDQLRPLKVAQWSRLIAVALLAYPLWLVHGITGVAASILVGSVVGASAVLFGVLRVRSVMERTA